MKNPKLGQSISHPMNFHNCISETFQKVLCIINESDITNQPPVRDSNPGAPLGWVNDFCNSEIFYTIGSNFKKEI